MKNILYTFILFCSFAFAQECETIHFVNGVETKECAEGVLVLYQDAKFQHIKDFKSFFASEELVKFIADNLGEKERKKFDESITVEFEKILGIKQFKIYHSEGSVIGVTGYITEKQFKKLFKPFFP